MACGSKDLRLTLDLGSQPPANSYKDARDEKQEEFPLAINRCGNCYHVQLTHVVDPDILYKNYLYVSGTSQTMKDHFKWFAEYAKETHQVHSDLAFLDQRVLDIGCNDGSQLDEFKALGYKTFGVDPALNLHATSSNKGHLVKADYFNLSTVDDMLLNIGKFDILTAQNVFAHNPDPESFLRNARKLMYDESFLFIQTSQADMILNNEFDTIYHEHISFYNVNSMNEVCKRSDVYLYDAIKCPLHGNSYIFVVTRDPNKERRAHIANLIAMEKKAGLMSEETYVEYEKKCQIVAKELKLAVDTYRRLDVGWYAVGYGAAAKGMTLLNFANVTLDYIIDDNPLKQGKFTPGMSIPIVSSDFLDGYNEATLFVPLAWNFYDEIRGKIKQKHSSEYSKYVRVFPQVRVES